MKTDKLRDFDVVVFDLDDTLYSERTYVESGYAALSAIVSQLYNVDFFSAIQANRSAENVLLAAIKSTGLPDFLLPHLVQIYRYHKPTIALFDKVKPCLEKLRQNNTAMYLVTDGRSLTQRSKIAALGITDFFAEIYISEEQGAEKPNTKSFELITSREKNKDIVYIGDNPKKDFIAPHILGWSTIGIRNTDCRVHPMMHVEDPQRWLDTSSELEY